VLRLFRRGEDEVSERARRFRIESPARRDLVEGIGRAFMGGYHAMLADDRTEQVAAAGMEVEAHYRPFFFEGAAMGYLPRCLWDRDCRPRHAERDLLRLKPEFRYLYYVGLGFGYGFRHRRAPARVADLAENLDPLYAPLCYDGFGFKLGFFDFDYPRDPRVTATLARCPEPFSAQIYQGFGRSMFFATMDDEAGWRALRESLPAAKGPDLEFGRALARGFTGIDRPEEFVGYIDAASGPEDRASRLTGITWALTARRMNDPPYFARCLERAGAASCGLLETLPRVCEDMRASAGSYAAWQAATRQAVVRLYRGS
jgi:hypothetical protein